MSGGVDSSLSAHLLQEEGYEVIGVTMALYNGTGCSTKENIEDARAVANQLGIPFHVLHMEKEFDEEVIQYFVEEYKSGKTPNPCVICNRRIKFDLFLEEAKKLGADYIATGHYGKVKYDEEKGRYLLLEGADKKKDQSYFLYRLTQDQLKHIIMPLADYTKEEVRELSKKFNLPVAEKKDSEDICFIPDGNAGNFLKNYEDGNSPGNFVDMEGNILGKHKGIMYYTVGQRRGLGLAMGKRVFVKAIKPDTNEIVIGEEEELYSQGCIAKDINLIAMEKLTEPIHGEGKIRYSKEKYPCTMYPMENGKMKVIFDEKVRAVTKGQAVVIYDKDMVIGGGTIEEVIK